MKYPAARYTCLTLAGALALGGLLATSPYFLHGNMLAVAAEREGTTAMIAHNVYFSLNDPTPENIQALVDACHKYLAGHPGTVFYAAGTLADLDRPVNDRNFHVGLHLVFENMAAHDQYQDAPRHQQFIEENKSTWKQVRVFDSVVSTRP
jgi:quinol monooxygenase YgiN